jgi:hypothetical protein
MRSLPEIVNITLANEGVSCFFNAFFALVYNKKAECLAQWP